MDMAIKIDLIMAAPPLARMMTSYTAFAIAHKHNAVFTIVSLEKHTMILLSMLDVVSIFVADARETEAMSVTIRTMMIFRWIFAGKDRCGNY